MRLILLLPDDLAANVRRAVPRHVVVERHIVASLPAVLSAGKSCRVVVDPTMFCEDALAEIVLAVRRSGFALAWYAGLSLLAASRVLRFQAAVGCEALLADEYDAPTVARVLGQSSESSVQARVLCGIADRMMRLNASLATAVVSMYSWGSLDQTERSVARKLHRDEAGIVKELSSVGLLSVSRLQNCAKVARVFNDLTNAEHSLQQIAERNHFGTERTLRARMGEFVGLPPRRAMRELNAQQFAARLVQSAIEPG